MRFTITKKPLPKKSTRRSRSRKKGGSDEAAAPAEVAQEQTADNAAEETPAPAPKAKAKKTAKTEDKKII